MAGELRTEFLALSIHEPVDGLYYWHNGQARPFSGSIAGLGQPNPYHGPSRLVLHRNPNAFLEDPPETPPIATVDLPDDANRILLLLFKREGQPLRVAAFPVDTDSLRPGDYRVFNLSSTTVLLALDEEILTLRSGENGLLSNPEWNQAVTDIPVQVGLSIGQRPRLVYSSIWGHYPGRRNFVFLFDGARRSNPIVFRRMHDWPTSSPAREEGP